jgi:hypothetical protein
MIRPVGTSGRWAEAVKPLAAQPGPPGLYEQPRLWAEGKDWTPQFGAHFSYGFLTQSGTCHPLEGAVVHPYDEVLVFAGTELEDILALGAQMSIELGEEREEHRFAIPTVVCVPKGVPHGPARVHEIGSRAVAHYLFGLAPEYQAEAIPAAARPAQPTTGQKYAHLIRPLRNTPRPEHAAEIEAETAAVAARHAGARVKAGPALEPFLDSRGVLHPKGYIGPGNADSMIWMYGPDLNDLPFNFNWGFFSAPGSGTGRDGTEAHTHAEPEALIWVGLDPQDLVYLGAEIDFAIGPEFERYTFDTPTCVVCPGNLVHAPLVVRWVDDPYVFLLGCLEEKYVPRHIESAS